jgi:AcrR family transcriptional regulator
LEPRENQRKRLPRDERERLILDEAVKFFAEVGFEGQTRALAERLGVTQPLLYRYFPDKESLIERVFDEVYMKRWKPEWHSLLADRSRPFGTRLKEFYGDFCREIFRPEWVRIFMYAGLKGEHINQRYLESIEGNLLQPLCRELRHSHGLPSPEDHPLEERELTMAWALHGSIFHVAMRKWIYRLPVPDDLEEVVNFTLDTFLHGCGQSLRTLFPEIKAAE